MNRKSMVVLVLLLLATGWWAKGRFFSPIANAEPRGAAIIVFGDSIAAGMNVRPDECYASLLAAEFGVPIVNAGVPGDTTASALKRLQADVLDRNPKVVLIELGGNDLLQQTAHTVTERNLGTMVSQIEAQGAAVVMVGVDGPFGIGGMGGVYRRVAKQYNTAYVPNIMGGLLGRKSYMSDQIHPNAAGHKIIAGQIAKVLRRNLPTVFK